ncbi:hypothetical protein MHYP_G00014500 [Metynnis hypsauchen]
MAPRPPGGRPTMHHTFWDGSEAEPGGQSVPRAQTLFGSLQVSDRSPSSRDLLQRHTRALMKRCFLCHTYFCPSVQGPSPGVFSSESASGRLGPAEFWETESCLEGLSSPSTPSWQNFTRELMQLKYFSVKRSTKTRPAERTKASVHESVRLGENVYEADLSLEPRNCSLFKQILISFKNNTVEGQRDENKAEGREGKP